MDLLDLNLGHLILFNFSEPVSSMCKIIVKTVKIMYIKRYIKMVWNLIGITQIANIITKSNSLHL